MSFIRRRKIELLDRVVKTRKETGDGFIIWGCYPPTNTEDNVDEVMEEFENIFRKAIKLK